MKPSIDLLISAMNIYQFCENADYFAPVQVEYKKNGPKLYLYPIYVEDDPLYHLLCFPDKNTVLKFIDAIEKSTETYLDETLEKYDISALMLDIVPPEGLKGISVMYYGCGKHEVEKEVKKFFNHVVSFLSHNQMTVSFVKDDFPTKYGLPVGMVNRYLENAVNVYPRFLEANFLHEYKNPMTKQTEYFLPVNNSNEDESLKATYLIFPNPESAGDFLKQCEETLENQDKEIIPDALSIEIYENNGKFESIVEPKSDTTNYDQKRIDEMVEAFLLELEEIHPSPGEGILEKLSRFYK